MQKLITFLGPTATGKTRLASIIASQLNGEIISADSRQVYKGLDLGTGKDYNDYVVDGISIPFHLIDIFDPREEYNVFRFKGDFLKDYLSILERKKLPILCGGTGLYLSAVLQNYVLLRAENNKADFQNSSDDELRSLLLSKKELQHNTTDLKERERIVQALLVSEAGGEYSDTSFINSLNIGVNPGRNTVKARITARLKARIQSGMIEEVSDLLNSGISKERLLLLGLEYKYITLYLTGDLNYNDMFQKLESAIHHFAKRQMTWFRKMEREGVKIFWLDSPDPEKAMKIIEDNYS